MRGLGSIPTGGNILSLDFISCSKASDANIGIIANFVEKPNNEVKSGIPGINNSSLKSEILIIILYI